MIRRAVTLSTGYIAAGFGVTACWQVLAGTRWGYSTGAEHVPTVLELFLRFYAPEAALVGVVLAWSVGRRKAWAASIACCLIFAAIYEVILDLFLGVEYWRTWIGHFHGAFFRHHFEPDKLLPAWVLTPRFAIDNMLITLLPALVTTACAIALASFEGRRLDRSVGRGSGERVASGS